MIPSRVKPFSWADPGSIRHDLIEQDGIVLGTLALSRLSAYIRAPGCWVWSVRSHFYYDRLATLPSDNITVVNAADTPNSKAGRWIRTGIGDVLWQVQATWWYDATHGNPEYPGTQAAPVSSMAELYRRTTGGTVLSPVTLNVVGGVGALSAGEAAILDILTAGARPWSTVDA